MDSLLAWIMGGGGLLAIVGLLGAWTNRRAVKSEAKARDAKTPAELDNLVAVTHGANLESLMKVNTTLLANNGKLQERLDGLDERLDLQEQEMREQAGKLDTAVRGLASAYAYITTLLKIIEEHLPNIIIPRPPEGYPGKPSQDRT